MPQDHPRSLPDQPNLDHLKKQAKGLLRAFQQGGAEAAARFRALPSTSPREGREPKLADALHVIANEYGFASWPALKARVESLSKPFDPFEALKAALRKNDVPAARRLFTEQPVLRAKINEPLPDYNFESTALLGAVGTRNREMIDVVLAAGADINAKSGWWAGGFGVLDSASRELAPYLIERGARLEPTAAARLGMLDSLKQMIAARPDLVNARGGDGQMPLHQAANAEVAEYLLDHGAEIDARDIDHESTPAQYAVRERQDVARFLVSRGCWTDILMAAALGDRALVEHHLAADPACIRKSVSDEWFPMQNRHAGGTIYKWTLTAHATAHIIAREFNHEDIVELLMDRSPVTLKITVACELGEEGMLKQILRQHPDAVQTLSDAERRKLVHAAEMYNAEAVRLMLAAGWPVDVRGEGNVTALHWAAFHGNADMVRELLRYHAPLNVRDASFNATALGWGLHGSEHGWHRNRGDYPGVIEALLQAGAGPPAIDQDVEELDVSEPVRAVLRRYTAG
jgi:hypothetical protein